jgi:transcriptional regulator with XRE-family HTH domain
MIQGFFGKAVRHFREQQGISQEELAHRCGLHRTYISDVERGKRNIGLGSIGAIADALGITLVSLFKEMSRQESKSIKAKK